MKTVYTCFPGGRNKALSFSYDDGNAADRKLVDLFNRQGLKGTFHLNSGTLGRGENVSAAEVASLYAGHEVSSHTVTHPNLLHCPAEQTALQVLEDRRRLEDLVGYTVRGLSYPYGAWNREVASRLASLGVEYARLTETTGQFYMEEDWLAWRTTCHHRERLLDQARRFTDISSRHQLSWFTVWGHSYEFDREDNWNLIEECGGLLGGRTDTWYATVIEMVDYMKAARSLRVAAAADFAENPAGRPVWLAVDGKTVEVPAGGSVRLSGGE